jgi:hypothetical protein
MRLKRISRTKVLCVALALAAGATPSAASAAQRAVDRGLVLRVRPAAIVVRELDGSRVRFAVRPRTTIQLDGRAATLDELERGDVVVVVHRGQIATAVRAFSP